MRLSYSRDRHRTMTALALVVGAISAAVPVTPSAVGSVSPLTDPHKIEQLAAHAYVWGLPAYFVYRFGNYSTLVTAPRNTLGGGKAAAAWNNNGTNAGDASVLYLNAMIDLSGARGAAEPRSSCSPCRHRGATTTWPTCSMTSSTRWQVSARGRPPPRTRRPTCLRVRPRATPISASRGSTDSLTGWCHMTPISGGSSFESAPARSCRRLMVPPPPQSRRTSWSASP